MKREIYLDNSATTPLSEVAKATVADMLTIYGNPSSLHTLGQEASKRVEEARTAILRALGVRPRQGHLFFTSCGTEATSLALFGTAFAKARRDATRILTTDSEHPSVARVMDTLAEHGFEIVRIGTRDGVLDMDALRASLDKKILLASLMLVNNETGAHYAVKEAFSLIHGKYPEAVTHCDAVQGFLKVPFTPATLGADLISISAHKLHAPKGVGALYVSAETLKAKRIVPFLRGGGQESGMRSGTENTIGIAAFGAVVADTAPRRAEIAAHLTALRDYAEEKLGALEVQINRPQGARAPHILHITLPDIKSETMLHHLSGEGIYVSSGSACSSHASHPSDTLLAFGLTPAMADCSLRISLSEYNTREDIDALCAVLSDGLARLVRIKR